MLVGERRGGAKYKIKTKIKYRMERKFGRGKVWRIDSFRAFGKIKFGELIDQPIEY